MVDGIYIVLVFSCLLPLREFKVLQRIRIDLSSGQDLWSPDVEEVRLRLQAIDIPGLFGQGSITLNADTTKIGQTKILKVRYMIA